MNPNGYSNTERLSGRNLKEFPATNDQLAISLPVFKSSSNVVRWKPFRSDWALNDPIATSAAIPSTVAVSGSARVRVAAVAAETLEQAQAAVEAIELDIEELTPILNPEDAFKEGAPVLHPDSPLVAGVTLDANQHPRLVLDPAALVDRDEDRRWLISSFRWETVQRCRSLVASIATAWLTEDVPEGVARRLSVAGHRAWHPWWRVVTPELVAECHDHGVAVNVWTCDDPEAITRLAGWGVEGICTNVPDVALAVLTPAVGEPGAQPPARG